MDEEEEKKSAGEELVNEGKKWAGKQLLKKFGPIILKMSIPVILVLLLGLLVFSLFDSTGDKLENILDTFVEFFTVDYEGEDGAISIGEEQIETIINGITEMGISIDGLKLMGDIDYDDPNIQAQYEKALKEYIRKFYEAQAMTETINTKPNWFQENIINGGKPYGTVYVHRSNSEENPRPTDGNQMDYMSYEEMKSRAEANDTSIAGKYFSIDENGDLVIAGWDKITVKKNGVVVQSETKVNLWYIDYKNVISQYITPMNFFFYLAMTVQNPEFVEAVIDLVKQNEIRLMVFDTDKEIVDTEVLTYTENTKTIVEVEREDEDDEEAEDDSDEEDSVEYETVVSSRQVTDTTEITTKSITPMIKIVYAKTWFSEQTIEYNKKKEETSVSETIIPDPASDPEPEGEGTWITNRQILKKNDTDVEKYEEGIRGNVIDKLGERGDQGIKDLNGNNEVDENEKVDENSTFLGLMDDRFKIPNTTRYAAAGSNLVSGAEIFFHLLQKDATTQQLEHIMRYVIYKYTEHSYGVTELDTVLINAQEFETTGSGLYGNTTAEKLWFALREAGFSEEAAAGVMANLWAKSGLKSNHLDNDSERYVGMTDQEYTDAINNGTYTLEQFTSDHRSNNCGAGYGIAEWTTSSSKAGLYNYAKSKGVGIDNEDMQIEYLIGELTASGGADGYAQYTLSEYKGYTVENWKNAETAEDAAKAFYWIYERPAKDETDLRVSKAKEYLEEYQGRTGGICTQSDEEIVKCYYTSTSGKTFTVLNQTTIDEPVDWGGLCNRAAAAIIASGYSTESPQALVTTMNIDYSKEGDPIIPTTYFEQYGLERTTFQIGGLTVEEYTGKLRDQLKSGGYAAIWLNGNRIYRKK